MEDIDRITPRQEMVAKYIFVVVGFGVGFGAFAVGLEAGGCGGRGLCGEGVYFAPESIPFIPAAAALWVGTIALFAARDLWRHFGPKRQFDVTLPPE